jgi:hypothetical protein
VFGHFYTLTEFSSHLMCIIKISTTCTCSSAPKWVEKSYVSLGASLGAMQEMGMNFKHLGIVARLQTLRNLVFKFLQIQNSSEVHEIWHGFMKWHQHAMVIFCPIWGRFWYKLLTNRASHKEPPGSDRERVTFVDETTFVCSSFQYFSRGNMDQ